MKRILAILFIALTARAVDVQFTLADFGLNALSAKSVTMQPTNSTPTTSGSSIVVSDFRKQTTTAAGVVTFTNVFGGAYLVTVEGNNTRTVLRLSGLPTNSTATVNAKDYLTVTVPPSIATYLVAGTNMLFQTNSGAITLNASGGSGGVSDATLVTASNRIWVSKIDSTNGTASGTFTVYGAEAGTQWTNAAAAIAATASNGAVAFTMTASNTLLGVTNSSIVRQADLTAASNTLNSAIVSATNSASVTNWINSRQVASANLTNWSNIPTGAMANATAADALTNYIAGVSNLFPTRLTNYVTTAAGTATNTTLTDATNAHAITFTNKAQVFSDNLVTGLVFNAQGIQFTNVAGKVGISTPTPTARLDVSNAPGMADVPIFHAGTNNSTGLTVSSNGQVGIGTTVSTAYALNVAGMNSTLNYETSGGNFLSRAGASSYFGVNNYGRINWILGDGSLQSIRDNGAPGGFYGTNFWATTNGVVGIGTNSPLAPLHIHKQASNLVFAISGITNATPATPGTVSAWLPITVNGTNFFMPLYQ